MDTCAVEVGLLKKHPCGQNAVAKCANCEMALCTKHAVAQLNTMKQRTGKFMCAECDRANKTVDTSTATKPGVAKPGAAPAAAKPAAPAPRPAAPAAKPAAPAPKPAAPAQAAAAPAAKPAAKPAEEKFKLEDTGPIEFTPTKKP
jgi:hypothetical protein